MFESLQPSKDTATVVDLLGQWAAIQPNKVLYRFLQAGRTGESTIAPTSPPSPLPPSQGYTYGGMDRQARRIAVWLNRRVACGECVVLAFPPGPEYLAAYFGCLYAGVIAVPAYPPRRNQRDERLRAMIADADVKIGLTTASQLDSIRASENDAAVAWHGIETMDDVSPDDWVRPNLNRQSIAFLQYTSGSTGSPKGVMVTHGNLLHNQHLIRASFRSNQDDTLVGWLPLHHDMGLIGNSLHPLSLGGDLVFMSPIDFLQKPVRWLRAISDYRGTVAGGPNFAYRLCAEEIDDADLEGIDLSSWAVAFNGAEPIDSRVLRQFADRFSAQNFTHAQFCPCYGMAETTLLVSSSVRGQPVRELPPQPTDSDANANSDSIKSPSRSNWIGCGVPDPSMDVRIVDPDTKREKPPGEIGEIWIAGDSVAAGYWKKPEQTRETFAATIVGGDRPYLRTGDLGLIDRDTFDGELFVTGRCKDLIIVRGVNHYPQDIERTAESAHPANAIAGGAAFAIPTDDGEAVVIVQELKRSQRREADGSEVVDAIRNSVAAEHSIVPVSIVLIRPGGLPKTTSGKVQRSEARRRFETNHYQVLHRWDLAEDCAGNPAPQPTLDPETTDRRQTTRWLIERIAARVKLPVERIETDQPFSRYGLDSVGAVRLAGELSEWLGRDVPATLAYEYPTISALANHLANHSQRHMADAAPENAFESSTDRHHDAETTNDRHGKQHAGSCGPIAIIGISCRFPSADSPHAFWNVLATGSDATGPCPHREDWYERVEQDGSLPSRGGYLRDVAGFDAAFFGISPREADCIDPQHRLLLELTHEVFEDAGVATDSLRTDAGGSPVGVFVGVGNNDYLHVSSGRDVGGEVTAYTATGNSMAMAANRISYTFDFRGPSLTIDTACSSSLVATHQAVRALGAGDCDYAIAAGVNLILSTDATDSFTKAGMLSPSGVCRAFDADADGFVRGEGGGAVLLRPLSEALSDGNRIYAVIQGSAINQDGRSNGLTAPSRIAQAALIRDALDDAGVSADSIDYVEAHGTGTALGDPIEVRAIAESLVDPPGRTAKRTRPLKIGSVKANIGHLEAAAGIAGLIKVALAMKNEMLPQQIHFSTPSPHIEWNESLQVVTEPSDWQRNVKWPRRAGVSSFGFGGTNAHVILEEPPTVSTSHHRDTDGDVPVVNATPSPVPGLLVCSAKSPAALRTLIASIDDCAAPHDSLAVTLATGRNHYRHRAASVSDRHDASEHPWLHGIARRDSSLDFYFSGQGGCHLGAGEWLRENNAAFSHEWDAVDHAFAKRAGHRLADRLWNTPEQWLDVWIQPALYCLQVATARFWMSIGVQPRRVVGHSLGEYAAACIAGVFDFDDGLNLVARRAELTDGLEHRGGMLAVFSDENRLRQRLADFASHWEIAAVNGPNQCVIAALPETLTKIAESLKTQGVTSRVMSTTHGFHSWLIEPILDEYDQTLAMTAMMKPQLPFVSSQTGLLAGAELATPAYWRGNLRNAVRFDRVFQTMSATTEDATDAGSPPIGMEIGAGGTLSSLARNSKLGLTLLPGLRARPEESAADASPTGTMPVHEQPPERVPQAIAYWETLAKCYVHGVDFDWPSALGTAAPVVSLPTYPFERTRHWVSARDTFSTTNGQATPKLLPSSAPGKTRNLPGTRLDLATDEVVFEHHFSADSYLTDHRVGEAVIFPAAGYLRWAIDAWHAVTTHANDAPFEVSHFELARPLTLDDHESVRCQLVLSASPENDASWRGRISSRNESSWRSHCEFTATFSCTGAEVPIKPDTQHALERSVETHYRQLEEAGMHYGPTFRCLESLRRVGRVAEAVIAAPEQSGSPDQDRVGTLDACLQVVAACGDRWGRRAFVPIEMTRIRCIGDITNLLAMPRYRVTAKLNELNDDTAVADLWIEPVSVDGSKEPSRIIITGLRLKATTPIQTRGCLLRDHWVPKIRDREPIGQDLQPMFDHVNYLDHLDQDGFALETIGEISDALEQAAGAWTIEILTTLGVAWDIGNRYAVTTLAESAGVLPQHHRLLQRLLRIAEANGVLRVTADSGELDWEVTVRPAVSDPHDQIHDSASNEFALLNRCAAATADVMCTGRDPLPLLFPDGEEVSAADVYRNSVGGNRLNRLAATAVADRVKRLASGRGLRILEIGAGTGATTRAVLDGLPGDACEYRFTDVAPGFLAAARRQFADVKFIDYQVLDIERDPAEQGFTDCVGRFDIVIAANVLHATADMHTAMRHIRSLMHPSGQLIVLEGTRPAAWLDLTFGLTPGWWRFTDTDRRAEYPLLSTSGWTSLLIDTGFHQPVFVDPASGRNDVEKTPRNDSNVEPDSPSKLILSSPVATISNARSQRETRRWLIVCPHEGGIANAYADRLRCCGENVVLVSDDSMQDKRLAFGSRVLQACRSLEPTEIVLIVEQSDCNGDDARNTHRENSGASDCPVQSLQDSSEKVLSAIQSLLDWQSSAPESTADLRLRWVTSGAFDTESGTESGLDMVGAALWAMWRTLTLEQPQWRYSAIDLDRNVEIAANVDILVDEFDGHEPGNEEVSIRKGVRYVRQWMTVASPDYHERAGRCLTIRQRGSLTGIETSTRDRRAPEADEIEIRVAAAGLNFRDVLNVLGAYPGNPPIGAECVGRVERVGAAVRDYAVGDRVVAIASDSIADFVTLPASSACGLDESVSDEDAATVPVAFLTAANAIEQVAGLRHGESILIHSAAGGVGMAAVQIARRIGARVFATSSLGKHDVLRELKIDDDSRFDSRTTAFGDAVLRATEGRGVDVVLNSLGEDFMDANLTALSPQGRYVDIALANDSLPRRVAATRPNVGYTQLNLSKRLEQSPQSIRSQLQATMQRMVAGEYQPLPVRVFEMSEASGALSWLRDGSSVGKAVIRCGGMRNTSSDRNQVAGVQIITGGLGGLGLLTTEYLIDRGATEIALLTRRKPDEQEQQIIAQWNRRGTNVVVEPLDLSDSVAVEEVIDRLRTRRGKIGGVYHLAGVLADATIGEQTTDSMRRVFAAKVAGAWNLHQSTQRDAVDDFVLFSSFSGWMGSPGQSNHAVANAFLDSLALRRHAAGLAAVSVGWGPWARVGAAAERERLGHGDLAAIGMLMPDEGIELLDQLREVVRMPETIGTGAAEMTPVMAAVRLHLDRLPNHLRNHGLLAGLIHNVDRSEQTVTDTVAWIDDWRQLSADDRLKNIIHHIREQIAKSLSLGNAESVPLDQPLFDLGMDSLTSLELVNSLQSTTGVRISTIDLFNFPDVRALAGRMVELLSTEAGEIPWIPEQPVAVEKVSIRSSERNPATTAELPTTEVADLLREIDDLSEQFDHWGAEP